MTADLDSAVYSHTDVIKDIRSQASLIPHMAESYRCMVVWDTRTNRDVGWLLVRKKGVEGMNAEEVETSMSRCQWRNWNLRKREECCGDDDECRNNLKVDSVTTGKEMDSNPKDVVGKNSDEASTSSEANRTTEMVEQVTQTKVDCAVQVEEDSFPLKDSFEATSCLEGTFPEELLLKTAVESTTETESSVFDKMEGIIVSVNINEDAQEQVSKHNSAPDIDKCSSERQLEKKPRKKIKTSAEEVHVNEVVDKQVPKKPLLKTSLGKLAEIESFTLDKIEVIEVSGKNKIKGAEEQSPVNSNKRKAWEEKTGEKLKSSAKEFHLNEAVEKQVHETLTQNISKDSKENRWKKYCAELRDCPQCGKIIKQKSFYMHLLSVHNIKSVLTNCNVCKTRIAEANLLMHRKTFHPERFKSDIICCSGCQNRVSAVDFDSHECGAEDVDAVQQQGIDVENEKIGIEAGEMSDVDFKSSKCPSQDLLRETCSDCHVAFAGDEIRYHDCKRKSFVRIKRLILESEVSKYRTQIELKEALNRRNYMCENCGILFDTDGKHKCSFMWKDKFIDEKFEVENNFEPTEHRVSLTSAHVTEQRASLTSAKVTEQRVSLASAKVTEWRANLTSAKVIEQRANLTSAKVTMRRASLTSGKVTEQNASPTSTKESEQRVSLTSAKVTEHPPQLCCRGEVFNMTVKLLGSRTTSLQIQSACLTYSDGSVLQFRLQLLEADGSITLQPLWLSVCSTNQHADLLKCLVPSQTACRQLGRDLLQFSMSCEQHCATTDCRFKLVVATKQVVLCYSREMYVYNNIKFGLGSGIGVGEIEKDDEKLTKPEQIQLTEEEEMVPQPSSKVDNAVCDDGQEMESGDLM